MPAGGPLEVNGECNTVHVCFKRPDGDFGALLVYSYWLPIGNYSTEIVANQRLSDDEVRQPWIFSRTVLSAEFREFVNTS